MSESNSENNVEIILKLNEKEKEFSFIYIVKKVSSISLH